jgi:hypothetical protein
MMPRKFRISSTRFAARSGWVEKNKCPHSTNIH